MEDDADILAVSESRQKRLLEELAALPIVEVLGVVAPSGASGGKSRGDDRWTLMFTFDAWRLQPAGSQTQPLTIRRSVTDEELKRFRGLISSGTMTVICSGGIRYRSAAASRKAQLTLIFPDDVT